MISLIINYYKYVSILARIVKRFERRVASALPSQKSVTGQICRFLSRLGKLAC